MTNEEAIEVLNNWDMACPICEKRKSEEKGVCADCRFNKALDLAIKALETGEIYITGEDYNLYMEGYKAGKKDFEPKQGKWIIIDDTETFIAKCSVCGRIEDSRMVKDYPFCHCGAEMRKGGAECMDEDAKQASIPYTYNAPQHDWKCGYPDITRDKGGAENEDK